MMSVDIVNTVDRKSKILECGGKTKSVDYSCLHLRLGVTKRSAVFVSHKKSMQCRVTTS